jgi:hypothetical protein
VVNQRHIDAVSEEVESIRKTNPRADATGACYCGDYGCYDGITFKSCAAVGKKFSIPVEWFDGENCETASSKIANMPTPSDVQTITKRSGSKDSGEKANWSPWYTLCSDALPPRL